ncbi:MAG: HAMP domain-containing histidine kinase [Oligoflexus sp.]|nr:HAMP domain-containing histidine kinase [Oligoflexus sp.]
MWKKAHKLNIFDWFIEPAIRAADADPARLSRSRVAVGFCFFLIICSLLRIHQFPFLSFPSLVFSTLLVVGFASLVLLRRISRHEPILLALILIWVSVGAAFAIHAQSIYTHFFTWLPLTIAVGTYLCGLRKGAWITFVVIVESIVVIAVTKGFGNKPPRFTSPEEFMIDWEMNFIAVEVMATALVYIFFAVRESNEKRLADQRLIRAKTTRKAALAEVVGSLAHELNNPLAIIHGSMLRYKSELARGTLDPGLRQHLWDCMADAHLRIETVTAGLKAFSGGNANEPFQEISFQKLYAAAERQIREKARSRAVEVKVEDDFSQVKLVCRPQQITFVLASLIDNACDALKDNPAHALVLVRTRQLDKVLRIEVIDNGPEILSEIADRLFQPFAVDDSGSLMNTALSACHGIVGEHGGRIGFDRLEGESFFWFELPITEILA